MTRKESSRWDICKKALEDCLTIKEASHYIGVCYRQARRIVHRSRADGISDIAHKSRGNPPKFAIRKEIKDKIISLAQEKYPGFNDTHLCEKLNDVKGISISREALRKLLRAAAISHKAKNGDQDTENAGKGCLKRV